MLLDLSSITCIFVDEALGASGMDQFLTPTWVAMMAGVSNSPHQPTM